MKLSELEELLAAARKAFGDREVGTLGNEAFKEPQLVKYFSADKPDDEYTVLVS